MPARVSVKEVAEVIPNTLDDQIVQDSMIDTANVLVDTHLLSSGLSTAVLKKVELYLAAHLVALTTEGGGITRSKLGDADESYAEIYGEGLKATRFGQMALSLDTTGTLVGATTPSKRAEFRVV